MLVYKCDICKKKLKNNGIRVSTRGFLSEYMFCESCAKPIVVFLKKNNLLKEK